MLREHPFESVPQMGRMLRRVRTAMTGRLLPGGLATIAVVAGLWVAEPGAALAQGSGYYVTLVARPCPSCSDAFASKARNDIHESLVDLGPDSPYDENSAAMVSPLFESQSPQDACTPLVNWLIDRGYAQPSDRSGLERLLETGRDRFDMRPSIEVARRWPWQTAQELDGDGRHSGLVDEVREALERVLAILDEPDLASLSEA
jgi:hypothetical protein